MSIHAYIYVVLRGYIALIVTKLYQYSSESRALYVACKNLKKHNNN